MEVIIERKGVGHKVLIDDDFWPYFREFNWFIGPNLNYVTRNGCRDATGKRISFLLHREVLGIGRKCDYPFEVDHINGNKFDNRKENLRICTRTQNCQNSIRKPGDSGFMGVHKDRNKWRVQVRFRGKSISLGAYDDLELAKTIRLRAEKVFYEEFSPSARREVSAGGAPSTNH